MSLVFEKKKKKKESLRCTYEHFPGHFRCTETSVCLGCKNIYRPGRVFAPHISQLEISRPTLGRGIQSVFCDQLMGVEKGEV